MPMTQATCLSSCCCHNIPLDHASSAGAILVTSEQFSAFAKQFMDGVRTIVTGDLLDQFVKHLADGIKPLAGELVLAQACYTSASYCPCISCYCKTSRGMGGHDNPCDNSFWKLAGCLWLQPHGYGRPSTQHVKCVCTFSRHADGVGILLKEHEVLMITPSKASSTTMQQLLARIPLQLMRRLIFPVPTAADPPHIEDFDWELNQSGTQNETASYDKAAEWINKYLCPPGVQAVLKDRCDWLKG